MSLASSVPVAGVCHWRRWRRWRGSSRTRWRTAPGLTGTQSRTGNREAGLALGLRPVFGQAEG